MKRRKTRKDKGRKRGRRFSSKNSENRSAKRDVVLGAKLLGASALSLAYLSKLAKEKYKPSTPRSGNSGPSYGSGGGGNGGGGGGGGGPRRPSPPNKPPTLMLPASKTQRITPNRQRNKITYDR